MPGQEIMLPHRVRNGARRELPRQAIMLAHRMSDEEGESCIEK